MDTVCEIKVAHLLLTRSLPKIEQTNCFVVGSHAQN